MTYSPALLALITTARPILDKAAPLGGTISCDLGSDGKLLVLGTDGKETHIIPEPWPANTHVDTWITSSLDALRKLQSGDLSPAWAVWTGKLKVDGDIGLAEKFGKLLQSVKV